MRSLFFSIGSLCFLTYLFLVLTLGSSKPEGMEGYTEETALLAIRIMAIIAIIGMISFAISNFLKGKI